MRFASPAEQRQFAGVLAEGKWVERGARIVSKAFLALHRLEDVSIAPLPDQDTAGGAWHPVYAMLPWEDLRTPAGPELLRRIRALLREWAAQGPRDQGSSRGARVQRAFGGSGTPWNEELAGDRFRLLAEAGLVDEAWRLAWPRPVTSTD